MKNRINLINEKGSKKKETLTKLIKKLRGVRDRLRKLIVPNK